MQTEKSLVEGLAYLTPENLDHFIEEALLEDVGPGDYSTLSCIPEDSQNAAVLKVKDEGVLAGMQLADLIFRKVDPQLKFTPFKREGDWVKFGDEAFQVEGSARSILTAERLVLNCMQRMSGVATKTRSFSEKIKETKAKILDTRKTSPNSRIIEKWAVAIGGGKNHRFALYDMVMLKDNHIDYAAGISKALHATRKFLDENNLDLKIEIETRNLDEVKQVLEVGLADIIMLDNFQLDKMAEAVRLINGAIKTEASGNVNLETVLPIAETGVDFISVGSLTYSYKSLDLSLKAKKE
jgi:nicotinate-nucleotide pyrophosphorylase (carboxylating)